MDAKNYFRRIYHGFDLLGNFIKGAKVESPTENYDISNKEYVDKQLSYDTSVAHIQEKSPKFDWLAKLFGKPLKQVLDELIYPEIPATYLNPTYSLVDVTVSNQIFIGNTKVSFYYENISGKVKIGMTASDRSSDAKAIMKIYQGNVLKQQFNSSTASNTEDEITFTGLVVYPNIKIVIEKEYKPVTIAKPSNYGNKIIPNDFKQTYTLSIDVTDKTLGYIFMNVFCKRIIYEGTYTLNNLNEYETYDGLVLNDFKYSKQISSVTEPQSLQQYVIGVPKELFDKTNIIFTLNNGDDVKFNKKWLIKNQKNVNVTYNDITETYVFFIADLGYFNNFSGGFIGLEAMFNMSFKDLDDRYNNAMIDYLLQKLKLEITGGSTLTIYDLDSRISETFVRDTFVDENGITQSYVGIKTINIEGKESVIGISYDGTPFISRNNKRTQIRKNYNILINDGTDPSEPPSEPIDPSNIINDLYSVYTKKALSAFMGKTLREMIEEVSFEEDLQLVKPQIIGNWTTTPAGGINSTEMGSNNISVENGYTVNWQGAYKWIHDNNKKDPTSFVAGGLFTDLPKSGNLSENKSFTATTSTTKKIQITAKQKGLKVVYDKVVYAKDLDIQEDALTVTFKHRLYSGVVDRTNLSDLTKMNTELISTLNKTVTGVNTLDNQFFVIAYPKAMGKLTSIIQNDALPVLEAFILSEQTIINNAGANIPMYFYTSKNPKAFTNVKLNFKI